MELVNEFSVDATIGRVWQTVGDLRQVASCLPGAVIDTVEESVDGEVYRGRVAIKVGPISLGLAGTATVVERDDDEHRMVIKGSARDRNGQGGAEALITVTAAAVGSSTEVRVSTDLGLSGKVAQFGSGLITQVSGRIVKQFVRKLGALIQTQDGPESTGVDTAGAGAGADNRWHSADIAAQRAAVSTDVRKRAGRGPGAAGERIGLLAPASLVALAGVIFGWALGRALRSPEPLRLPGRSTATERR